MPLSRRVGRIAPSVTFEIEAQIAELRARGLAIIGLGAGQPDFPTPAPALAAARRSLESGRVLYTASSGLPELRTEAARYLSATSGHAWTARDVVVTCGAKEGLALTMLARVDEGDEVVMPDPCWLSYEPMVLAAGGRRVAVATDAEDGFALHAERLARAVGPRTRVIVLNTPSNPTGAVLTRAELEGLARVLAPFPDAVVVSDEIYSPFVFEGEHVSPASVPGLSDRTVVVNGCSKAFSMTGWRIGFVAAPAPITAAIGNLKSHMTSNAATPSQHAALGALREGQGGIAAMVAAFARRRRLVVEALGAIEGVTLVEPRGAFYAFPRVDAFYADEIAGSVDFCAALLEEAHVALVPGAAFGEDRCVRLSYAVADEELREALERITAFLAARRPARSRT